MSSGKQASLGRNVKMFLCRKYTDEKLKDTEVSRFFHNAIVVNATID